MELIEEKVMKLKAPAKDSTGSDGVCRCQLPESLTEIIKSEEHNIAANNNHGGHLQPNPPIPPPTPTSSPSV
jgi:hypothetical protein